VQPLTGRGKSVFPAQHSPSGWKPRPSPNRRARRSFSATSGTHTLPQTGANLGGDYQGRDYQREGVGLHGHAGRETA
jgi:hypothetical protein